MASPRQLNPIDILFVAGENEKVYHHTAGLVILDTRARPRFDFKHFKKQVISRMELVPHFRWKLHEVPLGLDLPYWVEDENFSWDKHFNRIAVPAPGDRQALAEITAYIYSRHLDRSRPLWEMWFIEGLEGGKVGVIQKTHHCMMDGQGMQKLGEILSDFSPRGRAPSISADIADARAGDVPGQREMSLNAVRHWSQFPLVTARNLVKLSGPQLLGRLRGKQDKAEKKPPLPETFFNDDITAQRGFVFGTVSLEEIKSVKNAFDVTVNDVVLALVSSSLRSYLARMGALPGAALRVSLPVSLRVEGDDEFSNKVTNTAVTLATDLEDPLERLRVISDATRPAKTAARRGSVSFVEVMAALPPLVVHGMSTNMPPRQTAEMVGANLMVSNVRGSPKSMYMAGARLECMYPMSVITTGLGLNITCVSYCDGVDFGFTLAPERFENPWDLVDGLQLALEEYLALIPVPRGKARAVRKSTAKHKRAKSGKSPAGK